MSKLLLLQYDHNIFSRTFFYCETPQELIDHMMTITDGLFKTNSLLSTKPIPANDFERITMFIYGLYDFSYYELIDGKYHPYGKTWFIEKYSQMIPE